MLIAISGSQGTGKSTLISALQQQYNCNVVERKTARSILSDWNTSLDEVYQTPSTICKFQDELLCRKFADEADARASNNIWITERSFVDLLAYSTANIGRLNKYSDWLERYYQQCTTNQQYYDYVVYLKGGSFTIKSDGVRPHNTQYGAMIDLFMEHYNKSTLGSRLSIISDTVLQHRVDYLAPYILKRTHHNVCP